MSSRPERSEEPGPSKFQELKSEKVLAMFLIVMNSYFVYILASRRNGTLYTGVTNNLFRRVWEHRNGDGIGFTKKYGVYMLVWFEEHGDINEAILREKRIKRWKRSWKLELIERENPSWTDLYDERYVA